MDKRPRIVVRPAGTVQPPVKVKAKPSKFIMVMAFAIAVSLPYIIVKQLSNRHKDNYTKLSLSLPKLEHVNPVEDTEEYEDEETPQLFKDNEWFTVKPRSGDSMAMIFNRIGLSAKTLHAILDRNPHAKALTSIKPGQQLQFLVNQGELEQLIIPMNNIQSLMVFKEGSKYKSKIESKKMNTNTQYLTATVKGSLYTTAQRLNIPYKLIRQMTEVLGKDLNFSRAVRSGDQFSMIYDAYYIEDKLVGIGDIQVVSYTNQGKTYRAIRHVSKSGVHDYYRADGSSFKKAFSRYPIRFSHISSNFSLSRYHPILHYRRAHKGIDLAAPIGTPVQTIGDGVITQIGRHNGYGNMIKIRHDQKFSTVYGHMLRFQKGLSRGSRVKRGQVIGYVGQTGLASGPHCHFELHVFNQPRNPATIPLPTAASVPRNEMSGFKARTSTLLARLKLFEDAHYASKGRTNLDVG